MAKNKLKQQDTRQEFDLKDQIKKVKTGVQNGVFVFTNQLSIADFALQLKKQASEIIKFFFMQGKSYSLNHVLTEEEMGEVCLQYNYDFEKKIQVDETNILEHLKIKDEQKDLTKRCPIVTIMGHVDHGKTTLLDTIRKSRIVNSEFGGITQHIGAYQVNHNNNFITFIDTPGHEAFSAMRARGAKVTDIIVLVVAADDGIMPQTKEAILCAKNAKVPIIVFINKIDKPNISVNKVINQLAENNLVSEKWGGETIIVEGSALKNQGIDKLLDAIITLADVLELKANINRDALGVILEANIDKGLGPVATLIVQNGTIKKGDFIVVGGTYGKVRLLINDLGKQVNQAIAGQPVKVVGLNEVPLVGEKWIVLKDENLVKDIAKKIKEKNITLNLNTNSQTLIKKASDKEKILNVIVKCDVQGSLEAIKAMLEKTSIPQASVQIISACVGPITENDLQLAKTSKAVIIGFNVKPLKAIKDLAQELAIKIYFFNIIYKLKEEVINLLYQMLTPIVIKENIGECVIKKIWTHSKIGTICGCGVVSGKVVRNAKVQVVRNDKVIHSDAITSLHHGKDVVNEVIAGSECGMIINNFSQAQVGDKIQIFVEKVKKINPNNNEISK